MINCKAYGSLIIIFVMLSVVPAIAQMHVWTTTLLEGSPLSVKPFDFKTPIPVRPLFDQSLYWRGKNHPNNYEKTFYNVHSIYLRDSMLGVRLYGIDFDMLHEAFHKKNTNRFRYWNTMRMGFSFMLEKNYKHDPFPKGEAMRYINAEVFISYMHIPHKSRGDQSGKARVGTWMLFILACPSQKYDVYLKIRPFGLTWLKFYYTKEFDITYTGVCAEVELNRMGYDKSTCHSSKEIYKGVSLFGGAEINLDNSETLIRLGMKLSYRNH